jgi:hypothetical protein
MVQAANCVFTISNDGKEEIKRFRYKIYDNLYKIVFVKLTDFRTVYFYTHYYELLFTMLTNTKKAFDCNQIQMQSVN